MTPRDLFPEPFEVAAPAAWHAPVVVNSPHSGRRYPEAFLRSARLGALAIRKSEDTYVDELFGSAVRHGAPLLRMHVPRAYIDVNREPYELDPRLFAGELPGYANISSVRVVSGLGTIPRIVAEGEEIYRNPLTVAAALERVDSIYRPYHKTLSQLMDKAHRVFGAVLLVDCHSMPSSAGPQANHADIVLGDRHGSSCASEITRLLEDLFAREGLRSIRNKPYAGGFITQNYANPAYGRHVLQIEINRALYLNERTLEKSRGYALLLECLERVLAGLIQGVESLFLPARLAAE